MAANQLSTNQIKDRAITSIKIALDAGITLGQLADGLNIILRDGSVAFTANQPMGGNKITGLGAPTADGDAVTKLYVDAMAQGLNPKQLVRVATTANITLSGTQTIDGTAVVADDRVLVKNQTAPEANGIYIVAAGAWTRAADQDVWAEVPGAYVFVSVGTANADLGFVSTADAGGTLGTTAITWIQFSGAGSGLGSGSFVFNQIPTGAINGSNTSFALASTPVAGTVRVYRNGMLQEAGSGNDYTISGVTITYLYAPATGEQLRVHYIIA